MGRLSRTVFRNSLFGLGAQIAIKVLSFAFSVLIVRQLGAEEFGQYAAVGAFGAVFLFVADLGLSPYVVRQVARTRDSEHGVATINSLYANIAVLRILLSILAGALMVGFAWITERPTMMIVAIAINAAGLLLYAVQGTSEAMLSGFERLDIPAKSRVFQQLVFIVLGGVLLWLGSNYFGLIFANLIGITAALVICWRGVHSLGLKADRATPALWPSLLRASIPFGIIGFTLGLSYKFDTVLLNLTQSDAEVGYYNAAYNLVFSMVVLSNVFNTSLYPSLARQITTSPGSMHRIYDRAFGYLMVVALPITLGVFALSNQLVPFLFDAEYSPAADALRILVWVVPFMYASEFLGYVVVINGQEKKVARAIAVSTLANVLINLFVVPRYGFIGASVVTVLTEIMLVGQYLFILRADMRRLHWGRIVVRPALAAMSMAIVIVVVSFPSLAANIALGAGVYVALVVVFGVLGKDEIRFVRGLWRRSEAPVG
jgi:O-antigen/teichoic acid export membrane protein